MFYMLMSIHYAHCYSTLLIIGVCRMLCSLLYHVCSLCLLLYGYVHYAHCYITLLIIGVCRMICSLLAHYAHIIMYRTLCLLWLLCSPSHQYAHYALFYITVFTSTLCRPLCSLYLLCIGHYAHHAHYHTTKYRPLCSPCSLSCHYTHITIYQYPPYAYSHITIISLSTDHYHHHVTITSRLCNTAHTSSHSRPIHKL